MLNPLFLALLISARLVAGEFGAWRSVMHLSYIIVDRSGSRSHAGWLQTSFSPDGFGVLGDSRGWV